MRLFIDEGDAARHGRWLDILETIASAMGAISGSRAELEGEEDTGAVPQLVVTLGRAGAATLDLAYVAAGRLDGFWEFGLAPWDMAAGSLLITEAGGLVGDFQGNSGFLETGNIVGGNPKLFSQLIQALAPYLNDKLKK